uniref:Malectin-like domain-containing protein n=1 Tax=Oryza glumipatula TaxID=40148 RepID=A0A0D9Z327_9ORYZ
MPIPIAFLFLLLLTASSHATASTEEQIGSIKWIQDEGFIAVGNMSAVDKPNILPLLATVRYFPDATARKYCYQLPVVKGSRYLVRTTYFYGGFDGGDVPPVFDQIVDGTRWSAVNTTDNFRRGMSTYFEMVAEAQGKTMSVCLARRADTRSSPFISALELVSLDDSMYNTTDFDKYVMSTVARSRFGAKGEIVSYPDDQYNRYWAPFTDANPTVESHSAITPEEFWNVPPAKALRAGVTTSRGKKLSVQWPPVELPAATYYVALYFQDSRTASPYSWRVFDVAVNGKEFFRELNASAAGVMVYSTMMPLSGKMEIVLTPNETSPELARSIKNPPPDWAGDPCLPRQNSWTGVICSEGSPVRVVSLDLKNHGLSGSLPDSIGNLTGMKNIYFGGNKLTGSIPDLSSMHILEELHFEGNQLSGPINPSLGTLTNLKELYLNNNNLTGQIPESLKNKPGLDMRTEGNKLN